MADSKELILVNTLRAEGARDNGQPSFLREWEPVRFLGKGSFGEVYQIRRGSEHCALKIVEMDDEFIELYAAEIEALERIKNEKHAVRIYEYEIVNVDRGPYFQKYMLIRMDLLNKLPRSMNEDRVIAIGAQLCDILEKCHSGSPKIYHCDIKPENILCSDDGLYKLSDFGAARISDRTHNSSGFRGTPLYMSPEMYNLLGYDNRSDLYSLGVTMYTLLNNGRQPFCDGENSAQAIRMRFDGKKLPQIEGVSPGMMRILRKLCAAEPDRRYKSAKELHRDLYALSEERRKQREAEEAAAAAKLRAEQEAARRRAEQEAAKAAKAAKASEKDIYTATNAGGLRPERAVPAWRRPFGIIAAAAALMAAIVCGVLWLPKTTEDRIPELNGNVSAGDHVLFGSYPQTEDGKKRPIEWRVLAVQNGRALMISEYLLDAEPYCGEWTEVTWETSTLRERLNGDFFNAAFSPEEQSRIVLRTNENRDNAGFGSNGGSTTMDRVFCLSISEAEEHFGGDDDRKGIPTAYAKKNGAYVNDTDGAGWWWLRSPGYDNGSAADVSDDGHIRGSGNYVHNGSSCIRPVISVSL